MTDEVLLTEMEKAGLLDKQALLKLKREAFISGRSVEKLLSQIRAVDDTKLAELKSGILHVPFKKVDQKTITQEILDLIPAETAKVYQVAPLAKKEDFLVVGMVNPDDQKAQEALKFIARREHVNLGVYLLSYADWEEILTKYSPFQAEVARAVQAMGLKPGEGGRKVVSLEESVEGEEAPIIKIVADTFREAVATRASDVHIEPLENYLRVRFRVDGDLREVATLPVEIAQPVVSRVKVMSNLKIDETRVPQDGRFRSKVLEREIDFRVSTFPTPLGEKVAVRVLDPQSGLKNFADLDLNPHNRKVISEGLAKPFGMILASGPTGSGKTTTLYALLRALNEERVNIVSLEDPVEYFVSGVNQSQVRPEIGYDFAIGLRQILRQDPDIIMVGEIRDNETASLAVQAALTGHVVLSTLHTNNSLGVIPRLMDMKVEPFLLPVSLNLMLSQRLVGMLCDACKVAEDPPPAIAEAIRQALAGLGEETKTRFKEPYKIYHSKGCSACKNRGVVGRTGLFEVLRMTPGLEQAVAGGPTMQKILEEAKKQGMITLRQDGVVKALEGRVSIEEVIRETEEI